MSETPQMQGLVAAVIEDKPGTVVVARLPNDLSRGERETVLARLAAGFRHAKVLLVKAGGAEVTAHQALSEVTAERDLYKGRWERLIGHIENGGGG